MQFVGKKEIIFKIEMICKIISLHTICMGGNLINQIGLLTESSAEVPCLIGFGLNSLPLLQAIDLALCASATGWSHRPVLVHQSPRRMVRAMQLWQQPSYGCSHVNWCG